MLTSALDCLPEVVAFGGLHGKRFTSGDWREWSQEMKIGTQGHKAGSWPLISSSKSWSVQETQISLSLAHMEKAPHGEECL